MAARPPVLRLLWTRFAWRHWRMAPVSSALLLLILAMGVAAFFSIRLANEAAVAGFQSFTDLITSESDGLITAPVGTLPTAVLGELRQLLGNTPVNLVPCWKPAPCRRGGRRRRGLGRGRRFRFWGWTCRPS